MGAAVELRKNGVGSVVSTTFGEKTAGRLDRRPFGLARTGGGTVLVRTFWVPG